MAQYWTLDNMTICGSQTLVKLKFLCFMTFKGAYNDHKCCNVIALCCETQPVFTWKQLVGWKH